MDKTSSLTKLPISNKINRLLTFDVQNINNKCLFM